MKKYLVDSGNYKQEVLSYRKKTTKSNWKDRVLRWETSTGSKTWIIDHGNGIRIAETRSSGEKHLVELDYWQFGCLIEAYFIWKHEKNIIHSFDIIEQYLVAKEKSDDNV